jgi:hypothetical protein
MGRSRREFKMSKIVTPIINGRTEKRRQVYLRFVKKNLAGEAIFICKIIKKGFRGDRLIMAKR